MGEEKQPAPPGWYADIPTWARGMTQLGFAGLIALLYFMDARDRTHQLQQFQDNAQLQAREDRQMFRDDARANREEIRAAVAEMKRAVDRLDESQRVIKQDVRELKFGGADAFKAPPPREKPE